MTSLGDAVDRGEMSPYDTAASGALRFVMEIVAWVAGPWAAAELSGSGWMAIPALAVLLALPALFNTPGDKKQIPIRTPGPIRMVIEFFLIAVAVAAAWIVWPEWAGYAVSATALAAIVTGMRRYRWLARGAPAT